MNGFGSALWVESLKVRRSKMLIGTVAVFAFIGIVMGLLMFVAQHPEISGRSATLSAKTSAIGKGDWPSFFGFLVQSILALGVMGFGIVTSWIFGREFSDRTVKDLLALPVSRFAIVSAKFAIGFIWNIALAATLLAAGMITGLALHVPGWSGGLVWPFLEVFTKSAILTILLCAPVALVAGVGRGYLLPVGFVILTLILTQLVGVGMPLAAQYFPWAFPALVSGAAGSALPHPGPASWTIYCATILLGFLGTVAWWQFADHT